MDFGIDLTFENKSLTYRELDGLSNQFARYLKNRYSISPNNLVGIKLARTQWMIISILSVLKSGGAYVPIDEDYPDERIDYMLEDSGCVVVIDEQEVVNFKKQRNHFSDTPLQVSIAADDLAYVIYTSGSTGTPKGVMIDHHGAINTLTDINERIKLSSKDRVLALSSLSFDLSVFDIFGTLSAGASLVMPGAPWERPAENSACANS